VHTHKRREYIELEAKIRPNITFLKNSINAWKKVAIVTLTAVIGIVSAEVQTVLEESVVAKPARKNLGTASNLIEARMTVSERSQEKVILG